MTGFAVAVAGAAAEAADVTDAEATAAAALINQNALPAMLRIPEFKSGSHSIGCTTTRPNARFGASLQPLQLSRG